MRRTYSSRPSWNTTSGSLSPAVLLCCFGLLLLLPACATLPPRQNQKLENLQEQCSETRRQLDAIHHRLSTLQFMVDSHDRALTDNRTTATPPTTATETEMNESVDSLETTTAVDSKTGSAERAACGNNSAGNPSVNTPEKSYRKALAAYHSDNYDPAIDGFDAIIHHFPEHDLADNAFYWKGECLYARKDFKEAIDVFKRLVKKYPQGGKVPDALLKTGYAYYNLDDVEKAHMFLKKVIRTYPFSPAADKAEKMLKRIPSSPSQ